MEILQKSIGKGKLAIRNVEDLVGVSKNPKLWEKHFIQKANLNMKGTVFSSIGNLVTFFDGSFDGNGYIIENMIINCPQTQGVGLFGWCDKKANIQNVQLKNCTVIGADVVGGICGMNQGGRIEYCEVYGTIKAIENFDAVGSIVGCNCDSGIVDMNIGKCNIITDKEIFTDDMDIGYDMSKNNNE